MNVATSARILFRRSSDHSNLSCRIPAEFIRNGVGDGQFDLASRRIEKFVRLPVPVQAAHPDVRICGRPVHLPPALFVAPVVNQTIHVFFLDARLQRRPVSVLHELLPPAVARLCLLTDFKQRAQKLVRELVSGLALFLGELADICQQVRLKRNVLGRVAPSPSLSLPRRSPVTGACPTFRRKGKCSFLCLGRTPSEWPSERRRLEGVFGEGRGLTRANRCPGATRPEK